GQAVILALPAPVQGRGRRTLPEFPHLAQGAQPAALCQSEPEPRPGGARDRLSGLHPLQSLDPPELRAQAARHLRRFAQAATDRRWPAQCGTELSPTFPFAATVDPGRLSLAKLLLQHLSRRVARQRLDYPEFAG